MELKAKVWLEKDGAPVLGKGRAKLLHAIDEERSIRRAAGKLGMSYRYAWGIIQKISEVCGEDVVCSVRGGKDGGGTVLTQRGRALLKEYHKKVLALERVLK
jgi:molybdate transport system regulatory protein